ncbi:MAG: hypothetical protein V4733_03705 [Verrucomicrobiota bacterium]
MRKIKIIHDCFIGDRHAKAGDVIDLDPKDAGNVIAAGKGEEIKPGKVLKAPEPKKKEIVETRDPEPENRDPEPAKTKKAKASD